LADAELPTPGTLLLGPGRCRGRVATLLWPDMGPSAVGAVVGWDCVALVLSAGHGFDRGFALVLVEGRVGYVNLARFRQEAPP